MILHLKTMLLYKDIGKSVNQKKYKSIRYTYSLKVFQWESMPVSLTLAKKGTTTAQVLRSFVQKWNSKGRSPSIDLKKHPRNGRDVIVFQSKKKKSRADTAYYGECDHGYIEFTRDNAQILGIAKKKEKDMNVFGDILIALKNSTGGGTKKKKGFFKKLLGL